MFDIGWQELFLIAALALIIVGPKDLPRALRAVMKGIKKIRALASEFQSGVDDMAREVDLEEIKNNISDVNEGKIEEQIKSALDPDDDLEKDLDMSSIEKDMDRIAKNNITEPVSVATGELKKEDVAQKDKEEQEKTKPEIINNEREK